MPRLLNFLQGRGAGDIDRFEDDLIGTYIFAAGGARKVDLQLFLHKHIEFGCARTLQVHIHCVDVLGIYRRCAGGVDIQVGDGTGQGEFRSARNVGFDFARIDIDVLEAPERCTSKGRIFIRNWSSEVSFTAPER